MINNKIAVIYACLSLFSIAFLLLVISKSGISVGNEPEALEDIFNRPSTSAYKEASSTSTPSTPTTPSTPSTSYMPQVFTANYSWMKPIDYSKSHPFENRCRYPVLSKNEPDLDEYVIHFRTYNCTDFPERYVAVHQEKTGEIYVRQLAGEPGSIKCFAAKLYGALKPISNNYKAGKSFEIPFHKPIFIGHDQFSIECFTVELNHTTTTTTTSTTRLTTTKLNLNGTKITSTTVNGTKKTTSTTTTTTILSKTTDAANKGPIYRNAFSWVPPKPWINPPPSNVPGKYSIVLIVIESTSRTQFLRHMPNSYRFIQDMGFHLFSGYNKVGDNSLINLNTVLTGHIYRPVYRGFTGIISPDVEIEEDKPDIESYPPAIYYRAKQAGMATMWNDEIGQNDFGLYHYFGWEGFRKPIAHYYYRPLYEYIYTHMNAFEAFCDSDGPFVPKFFRPISEFSTRYANQTHFSFSFISRQTHDNPNNLELYDNTLFDVLNDLKTAGVFENTVVVVMGDHGNRVHDVQKTYSGRVEERMPFLSLYLPPKFTEEHPEKVENVRVNQNRLTTHFDLYETLSDILDITLESPKHKQTKKHGISFFDVVPIDRNCTEAMIPVNFCLCMEDPTSSSDQTLTTHYEFRLKNTMKMFMDNISDFAPCIKSAEYGNMTSPLFWTMSTMARSGVRYLLERWVPVERDAVDLEFTINLNITSISGKVLTGKADMRLLSRKFMYFMEINASPLIRFEECPGILALENICSCLE